MFSHKIAQMNGSLIHALMVWAPTTGSEHRLVPTRRMFTGLASVPPSYLRSGRAAGLMAIGAITMDTVIVVNSMVVPSVIKGVPDREKWFDDVHGKT